MFSSTSTVNVGSFALSRRASLWVLVTIGGVLAGTLLFDAYVDWVLQGDPLWSTVLENSILSLLALTLPYVGWRLFRSGSGSVFLPEAAKWTLVGCGGMIVLSGLIIGIHVLQGEIKPVIAVVQMTSVGGVAGLWVGHNVAQVKRAEQEAEEDRDRLANLLDGLPAPVVHGRFEGDRLSILNANAAFEEAFGHEVEEIIGTNLYEIVVPEEDRAEAPEIDRQAIEHGLVEREVQCLTKEGPRDFQLRVAQALDDGASETYSIYTDITDWKRRENELEQMREQVELALQYTDSLLFGIDLETESVWRRGAFKEFYGLQAEDAPTMETFFKRAIHPEDRERLRRFYRSLAEGERSSGEIEYRTNPESGACRWIRDSVNAKESGSRQLLGLAQDVTKQKERKEELRRKERQYQAVFEDPNILVGLLDTDGEVLSINRTALEYVGRSREDVAGKLFWNTPWFKGDEEVQQRAKEWVKRASDGEYVEFEADLSRAVGAPLVVKGVVRPVTNENGDVTSLLISDRDITEQNRREEKLRRTSARLTALYENSPDMINIHDGEGRLIDPNPRFLEKTGYDEEDLIDMKVWELDQALTPDRARAIWKGMETGDRVELEGVYRCHDDSVFPVEVHVRKLDLEGEDRFMAISHDITEQKKRERQLREAQKRMELALQHTGSVIFEINFETREVTRHGGFEDFFNVQSKDLPTWDVFAEYAAHPADRERFVEFYRHLEEGKQHSGTLEYRTSPETGEVRWIKDVVFVEEGPPRRLRGLARDVTQQKERTRELRQAKEEAEEASRLKTAMLANMSHEIRTPLTSIIGYSELLESMLQGEPREFADMIHASGRRLMSTLDSVLQLSKLEAGVEALDRSEVALDAVVEEVADLLAPEAEEKSQSLEIGRPDRPVLGDWNEDAVYRICRNLLENAIKFTPEGGRVEVRVATDGPEALLEVEDTGIGMDPEAVDKLFMAFEQESEGLGREYEGSGLGLSIVKRLAEEMGGSVEVETEKGKGSRFTVRLPISIP